MSRSPPSTAAALPNKPLVPTRTGEAPVRPDYFALAKIAPENVNRYLMELIYESAAVLEKKNRQLGTFDVAAFRSSFLEAMAVECAK